MPAIAKPNQHFNVVTYTATPGSGATVSGVGFQPDLLWTKNRNNVESHYWQDSVRGFSPSTGVTKMLVSNSTAAEANVSGITCTTTSDGFTVADSAAASGEFWFTDRTYVGWCWKAGGAAVTNTSGTISSQVSANPTAGFSVVTFTAPASGNFSAGHGLGVTPGMVITKPRGRVTNWVTWHNQLNSGSPGTTYYVNFNLTDAQDTFASTWGSTGVTSSVIGMGVNASCAASDTIVAYCFAPVAGYSAFGRYTGNGSTDGPFVYLGFRPRFIMFKRTDSTGSWFMEDSSRGTYNVMGPELYAESSAAEATSNRLDFLSNGFKMRAANAGDNANGGTYIYAAFAEAPFKFANGR